MAEQLNKEMEVLVFNLMCDLKKKEISPISRARLIQSYLDTTGLSQRKLASKLGVPHSTLQDWLQWTKISQEEYDAQLSNGFTHLDIYKSLRSGTLSGKDKPIDVALQNCISKLIIFKLRPPFSKDTKGLVKKLKGIVNVIDRQVK